MAEPRLSHQTMRLLQFLMQKPRGTVSGADIARETGMLSGTIYPILLRFERAGWVTSEWEALDPAEVGRPRKRFYTLTGVGYNKAAAALRELGVQGVPAWQS